MASPPANRITSGLRISHTGWSIPHDGRRGAHNVVAMSEFLAALLAIPTIVFTGLLGLVLLYWLTVLAGALDIDLGHHDAGGHDADMTPGGHETHGFLEFLSIGKVPVTIIVSVFTFLAWMLSMAGELLLRAPLTAVIPNPLFSLALFPAVVIPSFVLTAYAVRPLRGIFNQHVEHGEEGLVGRMVRITSRTADQQFGTATCDNAGAGILLNVVCRDGVTLMRDDMAVVVEFDAEKQLYHVAPFSHVSVDAAVATGGNPPLIPPPQTRDAPLPAALSTSAPPVSLERPHERPH